MNVRASPTISLSVISQSVCSVSNSVQSANILPKTVSNVTITEIQRLVVAVNVVTMTYQMFAQSETVLLKLSLMVLVIVKMDITLNLQGWIA